MGMCDEFRKISRMPLFRPGEPGGSAPRDSGPFGLWPNFSPPSRRIVGWEGHSGGRESQGTESQRAHRGCRGTARWGSLAPVLPGVLPSPGAALGRGGGFLGGECDEGSGSSGRSGCPAVLALFPVRKSDPDRGASDHHGLPLHGRAPLDAIGTDPAPSPVCPAPPRTRTGRGVHSAPRSSPGRLPCQCCGDQRVLPGELPLRRRARPAGRRVGTGDRDRISQRPGGCPRRRDLTPDREPDPLR
jgi:hypothetical protein